jgi:GNAT superfamily N-acetyltransferase
MDASMHRPIHKIKILFYSCGKRNEYSISVWRFAAREKGGISFAMEDIFTIRRATVADVPALLALVRDYWRFEGIDAFDATRVAGALSRLFGDPRLGAGWIAAADGEAAGYLLAVYVFSLEHQGLTAEIDEFFITEPHRGMGLGGRLLATAEAEFANLGCTNTSLQLGRGNEMARAFYARHGFSPRAGYELLDKMLASR